MFSSPDPVREYIAGRMPFLLSRRTWLLVHSSRHPWWVHVVFFRELWFRWCLVDILEESAKYVIVITPRLNVIWVNAERKTIWCLKLPFLEMIYLSLPCRGHIQLSRPYSSFCFPYMWSITSIRSNIVFCVCQGCVVTGRGPLQDKSRSA